MGQLAWDADDGAFVAVAESMPGPQVLAPTYTPGGWGCVAAAVLISVVVLGIAYRLLGPFGPNESWDVRALDGTFLLVVALFGFLLVQWTVKMARRSPFAVPVVTVTPGAVRCGDQVRVEWKVDATRSPQQVVISLRGEEKAWKMRSGSGRGGSSLDLSIRLFTDIALVDTPASANGTGSVTITLPRRMMHSLRTRSVIVDWSLWVHVKWKALETDDVFPLRILPAPLDATRQGS
jgi:hypothetical protein